MVNYDGRKHIVFGEESADIEILSCFGFECTVKLNQVH